MSPTLDGICTVSQNVPSGLTVSIDNMEIKEIGNYHKAFLGATKRLYDPLCDINKRDIRIIDL